MKLPTNLGLKVYLILFAVFSLTSFTALIRPDGTTSMYYHTMIIFFREAIIWYLMAVLDTAVSCLAVIPMFMRAFNRTPQWTGLFRWLFMLRIICLFAGHRYEYIALKASILGTPEIGFLAIGIWVLFVFPSFKEHYIYAFRSAK